MNRPATILTFILAVTFLFLGCQKDETSDPTDPNDPEETSFTDPRDGQTYKIVKIGNQNWFAENLNYSGGIQEVRSDADWAAIYNDGYPTEQPAWCYYENNQSNGAIYGKLYNAYAAIMPRLCPEGWHVATDEDWTVLTDYFGGLDVAAGKLKSTTGWNAPNTGANNISGFSALPNGYRNREGFNGDRDDFGDLALWWTSTETNFHSYTFSRAIRYDRNSIARFEDEETIGMACRCVQD